MDLKKAQIALKKINTLFNNISADDNISPIERDLMLSYIRNFYETFLVEKESLTTSSSKTSISKKSTNIPASVPAPKIERTKPVVVEIPDSIKEYATPTETPPPPKPVVVEAPAPEPKPQPQPKPKPQPKVEPIVVEEEHDILFEQKEAKELSDKLSSMPITDLKKSMGLNEKILTINELFGGDNKAFDKALTDLNALDSFQAAKTYMSQNLAGKYEWASTKKKKKAQIFIKLVRRRYK